MPCRNGSTRTLILHRGTLHGELGNGMLDGPLEFTFNMFVATTGAPLGAVTATQGIRAMRTSLVTASAVR